MKVGQPDKTQKPHNTLKKFQENSNKQKNSKEKTLHAKMH
jgi:hypothetical protein